MSPEDRKLLIADRWWDQLPRPIYAELEKLPCSEEWFEVYRIAEGVYALYEPGQFEEAITTLIVGSEKAALVDTGCGIGNIRKAVEELLNVKVKGVKVLHTTDNKKKAHIRLDPKYNADEIASQMGVL